MKLFSIDSPFYKIMTKLMNIFLLNLCFLITSIPVITLGASFTAMFDVMLKMVDDEEGYVMKQYFKAFKANLKQGIPLGILNLICAYAVYLDFEIFNKLESHPLILLIVGMLSAFYFILTFMYAYPQVARYDNKLYIILRNSWRIAIKNFGWTLLMLFVVAIEVVTFLWNLTTEFAGVIIGPGLVCYTISLITKKVFKKMEKARSEGDKTIN